jgi:hypothetical protein
MSRSTITGPVVILLLLPRKQLGDEANAVATDRP